jgi:hypothetical protein
MIEPKREMCQLEKPKKSINFYFFSHSEIPFNQITKFSQKKEVFAKQKFLFSDSLRQKEKTKEYVLIRILSNSCTHNRIFYRI